MFRERDFDAALAEADAAVRARGLPHDAAVRLDARFSRPAPRRWPLLLIGGLSVAAGFALVQAVEPAPELEVGGFTVPRGEAAVSSEPTVQLEADTTVTDAPSGLTVRTLGATQLRKERRGVRVIAGRATFEVKKVAESQPSVRVLVAGGSIEVRGTRFTVTESGTGAGEVTLHEGRIDFVSPDGAVATIAPGQTLSWPLPQRAEAPAPPAAEPEDLAPLPMLRPLPRVGELDWREFDRRIYADAVIGEMRQLGRRGAWDNAVRMLERELSRGAPTTRERLSWELGVIYAHHVGDRLAACAHWAQHRREYPRGRYDALMLEAQREFGCRD